VAGRPAPGTPALKRLMLPQGELAQLYDGPEGVQYLAYAELHPGADRGHHYHKLKQEWVYLIHGRAEMFVQDLQSAERASLRLQAGDLVFIPTGIIHAFRPLEAGQMIEFSPARFDPQDIYPFRLT